MANQHRIFKVLVSSGGILLEYFILTHFSVWQHIKYKDFINTVKVLENFMKSLKLLT